MYTREDHQRAIRLQRLQTQFWNHRSQARRKGVPWDLTFEEWLQWWVDQGVLEEGRDDKRSWAMVPKDPELGFTLSNLELRPKTWALDRAKGRPEQRPWSRKEKELLANHRARGLSLMNVAERLGRGYHAVMAMKQRLRNKGAC